MIKDLGLRLESGKDEARAWELHQAFCEFVGGNWLDFLKYFCSMLLGKRILLGFLGFCAGTFPMLRTLLAEFLVLSHFVFVNRFMFYSCTMVVRMAGETIFVHQVGGAVEPIVNRR